MNEARDKVSYDLVTLCQQLRLQVMLGAIIHLDLLIQSHYLVFMGLLSPLELRYVIMVDVSAGCEMRTLPVVEGVVRDQAVDSNDRTDKEGLTLLETLDGIHPSIIDIC